MYRVVATDVWYVIEGDLCLHGTIGTYVCSVLCVFCYIFMCFPACCVAICRSKGLYKLTLNGCLLLGRARN